MPLSDTRVHKQHGFSDSGSGAALISGALKIFGGAEGVRKISLSGQWDFLILEIKRSGDAHDRWRLIALFFSLVRRRE